MVERRVLSGPAILRISILLIIAGALAALVQSLLPATPPTPVEEPPAAERPAEPAPAAPTPQALAPAAPVPAASPAPASVPPPPVPDRKADDPAAAGPARMPTDALAFPPDAAPPKAAPSRGEAEVARAENSAGPPAVALVDLNTASVADLNRLQGGGTIGRAIVSKRPYASVDQLLTKRVLSRAIYDRIRQQVTVR